MGIPVEVDSPMMGRRAAQNARLTGFSLWPVYVRDLMPAVTTIFQVAGLCC